MDNSSNSSSRRPRFVIEAKVRQVGFFTPISDLQGDNMVTAVSAPVAMPPITPAPAPVPVPVPESSSSNVGDPLIGSYNPGDPVLGASLASSSSNGLHLPLPVPLPPLENLSLVRDGDRDREEEVGRVNPVGQVAHASPRSSVPDPQTKPLKEKTSRAERRAKQEAEREAKRAAKETGKDKVSGVESRSLKSQPQKRDATEKKAPLAEKKAGERGVEKEKKKELPPSQIQYDDPHRLAKARKRSMMIEQTDVRNRVELFRHLPQFAHGTLLPSMESKYFLDDVAHPHPSVYQVGLRYITGDISGANARCVAMLEAFKDLIKDYKTPKEKTLVRDLTAKINAHVSFLIACRPLAISMGNAIKFLKMRVANLPANLSEAEAKTSLFSDIDRFVQEKIVFADREITRHAVGKIKDEDVLLIYGASCVVEMVLLYAFEIGRQFRVIIVDSRPKLEGKGLLSRLLAKGISCTYTHINAVSYVMQEATRVFLGASSVLSNGTVYSRVGTACVAMVANAFHIPVMICCESYKFNERVLLDSICSNELGDPDALVKVLGRKELSELQGWCTREHLQLLNLIYDTTPADYVSMIITELGMVPPTSVPVILREYRKEPIL